MASSPRYIYGRHPVSEALMAEGAEITALYLQAHDGDRGPARPGAQHADDPRRRAETLAGKRGIPVHVVHRAALDRMVGRDAVHQGMVAQAAPFAYAALEDLCAPEGQLPLYVLLDQVQDPHNVGAIVRSALALGAHGLIVSKDRSPDITATVIKAAAGATSHLPIVRVTNISRALVALKKQGLWIVGTAVGEGATALPAIDLTSPTVLVIGSEGDGMRPLTARHCDLLAHIPIGTIGSLNASVAAAICLYEAAMQRTGRNGQRVAAHKA